jgi:hypothetical protein
MGNHTVAVTAEGKERAFEILALELFYISMRSLFRSEKAQNYLNSTIPVRFLRENSFDGRTERESDSSRFAQKRSSDNLEVDTVPKVDDETEHSNSSSSNTVTLLEKVAVETNSEITQTQSDAHIANSLEKPEAIIETIAETTRSDADNEFTTLKKRKISSKGENENSHFQKANDSAESILKSTNSSHDSLIKEVSASVKQISRDFIVSLPLKYRMRVVLMNIVPCKDFNEALSNYVMNLLGLNAASVLLPFVRLTVREHNEACSKKILYFYF